MRKINPHHASLARELLNKHHMLLNTSSIPMGLADDIAEELQKAFDLGFQAAGGSISRQPVIETRK